jgi:hypothetical protein
MENEMTKTTPEQNKALVLEAFDTLFNKRDYEAAARFWSDRYIQHSAHIEPGRDGLTRSPIDGARDRKGLKHCAAAIDAPGALYAGTRIRTRLAFRRKSS